MSTCPINPASETVADFIYRQGSVARRLPQLESDVLCYDAPSSREFAIIYIPLQSIPDINLVDYDYYSIPKLYTLLDSSSLESSGIL